MNLIDLVHYLDGYLNCFKFNDFCPNGLQIEGKENLKKIACAVSADCDTLEQARDLEADALIVHHGLFWNRDPYPILGKKRKKIQLLFENEISLLAYHLPLDAHHEVGNNWKAALDLGWDNVEPFGDGQEWAIGVKGTFKPQSIESFISSLEEYYGHRAVSALGGKKIVKSAALISGGAYKELSRAVREGVDCFITGNFDEPAWSIAHEENIHFLALGHSATEKIGPRALSKHLEKTLGIPCFFIDSSNPF